MPHRVSLSLAAASTALVAFAVAAQPAHADYAPTSNDVVGVGSDTVQYASDFVADGDYVGNAGYNTTGNRYKLINFDATPDANARLAYGADGTASQCAPGTGATAGTGNQSSKHSDNPCTLNPTIVLRAGVRPILRPNGSGAGAKALLADTSHYISYARASSSQKSTLASGYDSITIGTDPLKILAASTTNAVPLSTSQLTSIYNCTATQWTDVGGTSTDTIIPILPQVGSGTRSSFLSAISVTTPGSCVKTGEENDPAAIFSQSNSADAIEPMSGGRLNLFQGKGGDGKALSHSNGGYFRDPSCSLQNVNSGAPAACAVASNVLSPDVKLLSGTPSAGGTLFEVDRPLYIYFRHDDLDGPVFQPGSTLSYVRELFANPCTAPDKAGCVTDGNVEYGAGGPPWYAQPAGQTAIASAGISPTYVYTPGGL